MRPDLSAATGAGDAGGEEIARRLRALPVEVPPPFDWEELRRRAARRHRAPLSSSASDRTGATLGRAAAAVACAALLVVIAAGVSARLHIFSPGRAGARAVAAAIETPQRGAGEIDRGTGASGSAGAADRDTVAADSAGAADRDAAAADSAGASVRTAGASDPARVLEHARAAQQWLASNPEGPAIVRVSAHLAVASLEDRIASMDDELDAARVLNERGPRSRALELDRARLVDSLAQVRYAEILASEAQ